MTSRCSIELFVLFHSSLVARHQKTDTETLTFMASFDSMERVDDDRRERWIFRSESNKFRANLSIRLRSLAALSSPLHAQLQHFWSGYKF